MSATCGSENDGELKWLRDPRWSLVREMDPRVALAAYDEVVVVAAHPDDETFGAGALIADAARLGLPVTVVWLTSGEASHPRSPTTSPAAMASRRRSEARRAMGRLAPQARLIELDLPDSRLNEHVDQIERTVRTVIQPGSLVLAPWAQDGHTDHDVCGAVVSHVVAATDEVEAGFYLLWSWHWSDPEQLPWADLVVVNGSIAGLEARSAAEGEYLSQTGPLTGEPGDEALLSQADLAPWRRGFTALVSGSRRRVAPTVCHLARGEVFDALMTRTDDPWDSARWYERRKRALTEAVLSKERYRRVLDLGASVGVLTHALGKRSDAVLAIDVSSRAVEVGVRIVDASISWVHGEVPGVLESGRGVDGTFDLVMVSDVAYFLTPFELWRTVGASIRFLDTSGELVFVNWRHPTEGIPLNGALVRAQTRAALWPWLSAAYEDEDVVIDVFTVRS